MTYNSVNSVRLTLGLMGLDELHLRVLAAASDCPKEKLNARKGRRHILFSELSVIDVFSTVVLLLMEKGRHWVLAVSILRVICVLSSF